ncbi:HlyD family efflux transporter periplasmic adaptor subunit [Novosphingobium sp.]|uniref:HlyD family efflux transporter periplasmic adaptor subunit n=1 Tax=Novosphingobium sp. TaxID=1874826 RepID=UPI003D129CD7
MTAYRRLSLSSPIATQVIRVTITALIVILAILAGWRLWTHAEADPWTRDGRVRADAVQIAPDVAGLVTGVFVGNDAVVHRGQVLFEIDRPRFQIALAQAQAGLTQAQASQTRTGSGVAKATAELAEAQREAQRNRGLGDLVATEVTEQSETKVAGAQAALADAQSAVALAQAGVAAARSTQALAALNLERTRVLSPVDGRLSDMTLRPGDYVTPGKAVMALVDTASLRIEGYFEETKLPAIHPGQRAIIHLMGDERVLHGHVLSIAAAIEDHDRTASASLLPAINPNFSWVRLAQRVPVRIAIDNAPADIALIPGRTATVTLDRDGERRR